MSENTTNYFSELNSIDVSDKVEKKNGLSYLSWTYAWAETKKRHPDATYTIYERITDFGPVNYFTDGKTAWVKVGVTINGIEHIDELPIMDYKNKSIALDDVTSFDVNKTIQRSLTKAIARHGLGLYVYSGEDLPEDSDTKSKNDTKSNKTPAKESTKATAVNNAAEVKADSKLPLKDLINEIGKIAQACVKANGSLDAYNAVIAEVTGGTAFKCSKATEEDYDTVLGIYNRLKTLPFNK